MGRRMEGFLSQDVVDFMSATHVNLRQSSFEYNIRLRGLSVKLSMDLEWAGSCSLWTPGSN